jgi:UDP-N-acetylglucosamine acyltransferase
MSEPNRIHESAVIGPGVELGHGNVVGPHAVVIGPTLIGNGNWIGPHTTVGTPAEIRKRQHAAAWTDASDDRVGVIIGDDNVLREYVAVHQPAESAQTTVGNRCYLMAYSHVAHDCVVGDDVTLSSGVHPGGSCWFGTGANIGMGASIHQRLAVGAGAMVGMGAVVTRDMPPFALAYGVPAAVRGANQVALRRLGIDDDVIAALEALYRYGKPADELALLDPQVAAAMSAFAAVSGRHQ